MTALKSINPLGGVGEREKKRSPSFSSRGEIAHLHSKRKGLLDRWGERNRSVRKRSEEATSWRGDSGGMMVHAKGWTPIRFIESDGERLPFHGYPYTFISDADAFCLLSPNHKRKTEQTITVMPKAFSHLRTKWDDYQLLVKRFTNRFFFFRMECLFLRSMLLLSSSTNDSHKERIVHQRSDVLREQATKNDVYSALAIQADSFDWFKGEVSLSISVVVKRAKGKGAGKAIGMTVDDIKRY